jgi:hypothetical protein
MLKSIIINKNNKQIKKYPYLGILDMIQFHPHPPKEIDSTLVVLFSNPNTGTVIKERNSLNRLGYYSTNWVESDFKFCSDSVCLFNSTKEDS